jgi:hypothetical protein
MNIKQTAALLVVTVFTAFTGHAEETLSTEGDFRSGHPFILVGSISKLVATKDAVSFTFTRTAIVVIDRSYNDSQTVRWTLRNTPVTAKKWTNPYDSMTPEQHPYGLTFGNAVFYAGKREQDHQRTGVTIDHPVVAFGPAGEIESLEAGGIGIYPPNFLFAKLVGDYYLVRDKPWLDASASRMMISPDHRSGEPPIVPTGVIECAVDRHVILAKRHRLKRRSPNDPKDTYEEPDPAIFDSAPKVLGPLTLDEFNARRRELAVLESVTLKGVGSFRP